MPRWRPGPSGSLHTSTESILTKARRDGPDRRERRGHGERRGRSLLSLEAAGRAVCVFLAGEGLPVVVANPTMPVGPGDRGLSPPSRLILDFCRGRLPAMMDCTLNLIDVRDVAHGLCAGDGARHSRDAAICLGMRT